MTLLMKMFRCPVFLYRPNLSGVVDLAKIGQSQIHTSQVLALLQVLKAFNQVSLSIFLESGGHRAASPAVF